MGDFLRDKVAIVTGAGRGIGRSIALTMSGEGAAVVVNDFGGKIDGTSASSTPADEVVASIKRAGGKAIANYGDVSIEATGETLVKAALDNFGRLDILVNNAGILRDRMIFNMTPDEWDRVIKVHLYGAYNCARPACIAFRQQKSGRIINMSSSAGLGNMGQANYSAAKEGIIGFTRTVARDMGRYGVTCNAIRPLARTRLSDRDDLRAATVRRVATGIAGPTIMTDTRETAGWEPEAVAVFVAWLASDEAAGVNGYDFAVCGGHIGLYSQPEEIKCIDNSGGWTLDELRKTLPATLTGGLKNPSPPAF
ncbi:MAG: SDR family NAD(P)-dependent oxidoreductase [Dehalococcoidia bacterium]|nr:SDR family NAD(P)-dependent oxidoreductase [Dehalococcoidia bacterium]